MSARLIKRPCRFGSMRASQLESNVAVRLRAHYNDGKMLAHGLSRHAGASGNTWKCIRLFSSTLLGREKALPPRRVIDENEITESFLKGSGPGGQKINKTSSAVQLKHGPTGIVVKCQETRSRDQNRKLARQILGEKLDELEKGDESRTAIKAKRLQTKRASAAKKSRRKYKKLEDEKSTQAEETNASEDAADGPIDESGRTPEDQSNPLNVERESNKP